MAKSKSVVKDWAFKVGTWVVVAFVLVSAVAGGKAYYELYVAKTGVQTNDGKQLTRADLLDMVLISAVKQAQEQNRSTQKPE